ncbi:uncharacterized protein LOC106143482 isoform X3 [Amyelois transitella]|uniref:uncharacterized protein LOC106143482 isoform X3 n=2 Tax=Amyelois transitella TaxID=680683 RepID=UPI00298FBBEE|nr:uncharacterized protein LOC106143482 isoform X3 [Amyelois transitella]
MSLHCSIQFICALKKTNIFRVLKMNSKVYKWCAVPQCKNTSIKTPNKVFVHVPNKKIMRVKWLKLARRDPNDVVTNSPLYFCEDHFDLPNDMENYMQYHVMGSVSQVRMISGCMPKKFICQSDRKTRTSETTERPYIAKKRKMMILEECERKLEEKDTVTKQSSSEEIASTSGIKDSSSNEGTSEPPVERPMGETSEEVCTQPMDLNKQTNEPDLDALGSPSPSHSDVPEPEPMAFSWQNTEHIIVEKDNLDTDNIQPNENAPDSMQDEKCHKTLTEAATREEEYRKEKHTGFSCDYCLGDIVGFRYTCIQCENFDLCAACESRLVHPLHYMLRVSMPKPYNEVRRVITAIRDKLAKLEEDFRQCSVLFDDVLIKKEEDPLVEESVEPLPSVLGEAVQPETVPNVDDSLYGISEEPNTFWLSSKHTTLQNEDCGRSSEDHYVDGSQHRREEPFIKKEYEEEELLDGTWFGESDKDNNRKRRIIVVNKFQRGKMRKPVKSKDVCVNEGRPEQSY